MRLITDPTPRGISRKTMVLAAASSYERGKGGDRSGKKRYSFVSTKFEVYTCKAVNLGQAKEEAKGFFMASHSGEIRVSIECDGNMMHFEDPKEKGREEEKLVTTLLDAWEKHCPEEEKARAVPSEKRADGLVPITNKYATSCKFCGEHIPVGERVLWQPKCGVYHTKCVGDGKWTST